ncbi:MAG: multidrug effflux MFS transporter [Pseudomonadota bacterium]
MPERLSRAEFVALMAMMFATIAFSIDAMLPALPEIAGELTPDAPNRAQLIITSFVLGMGVGTLFSGPLSDAYGRRTVIFAGAVLYVAGAALAWAAQSLELVLAARVIQGLGAAGPRVVALAIIRDLYEGRRMAQLMSFVMLIFTLIPAVAPAIGAGIIALTGWRGIFLAFIVFSVVSVTWLAARQRETHPPNRRRPFRAQVLAAGIAEAFGHRQVVLTILVLSLTFGMLFTVLASTQPVFDVTFGRADTFHWWFALIALISGTGSILNAQIVMRLGMRRVVKITLAVQIALSGAMLAALLAGLLSGLGLFTAYVVWTTSVFFMAGLTIGNLNALAMAPLGHIAGMAASIAGSVATVAAVMIAVPIGLAFDGTPRPLVLGVLICAVIGFLVTRRLEDPTPEPVPGPIPDPVKETTP